MISINVIAPIIIFAVQATVWITVLQRWLRITLGRAAATAGILFVVGLVSYVPFIVLINITKSSVLIFIGLVTILVITFLAQSYVLQRMHKIALSNAFAVVGVLYAITLALNLISGFVLSYFLGW